MRKLLLITLLLFTVFSFGQIQKIEQTLKPTFSTKVAPMGVFWAGASCFEDVVEISFQDTKFTRIVAIRRFTVSTEDFESLGKLLTSPDNKEDDFYSVKTIEGKKLYIKFTKMMGVVYPYIFLEDSTNTSTFPNLSKKQFKTLFNLK